MTATLDHPKRKNSSTAANRTHTAFHCWRAMHYRCKHNKNYVGRITVCEAWQSFEQFAADMGPRPSKKHTIERLDNEKGYYKSNCVWATRCEQNRNKRNKVMLDGQHIAKIALETNIPYHTLWARARRGNKPRKTYDA